MHVVILSTKYCHHCPILKEELEEMGINCQIQYLDDHPELMKKYDVHCSPILLIDGEVVFRGTPEKELPNKDELQTISAYV